MVSTGDQLLSTEYVVDLPLGLCQYLMADIQQVSTIVWVAMDCWVIYTFSDVIVVLSATPFTKPKLLRWWCVKVVVGLVSRLCPPSNTIWSPVATRLWLHCGADLYPLISSLGRLLSE
jgi:hypothetical protein